MEGPASVKARGRGGRVTTPATMPALLAAMLLAGPSSGSPAAERRAGDESLRRRAEPRGIVVEDWGLEIFGVRRTAGGYMLEFRYRVLDAEKAAPVFARKTKPRLIHQATGSVFIVPTPAKVGPLRNSDAPIEGRIYWLVFANPAQFIALGSRVTVEIGDFKIKNLVVE